MTSHRVLTTLAITAALCLSASAASGQSLTPADRAYVCGRNFCGEPWLVDAAERHRKSIALEWYGKVLPNWSKPCPIKWESPVPQASHTSFAFDRGQVSGWRMVVNGPAAEVRDNVLPHEVSHTVFATLARKPIPRWLDEGAATWSESRPSRSTNVLRFAGRPAAFSAASLNQTDYERNPMSQYDYGAAMVGYLVEKHGRRKVLQLMMQPNDRVDIYVTYRKEITRADGKRADVTRTKTLLEFVQIFQVDNVTAANGGDEAANGNTKHLSLLVTPEQATALTLAQDKGRLSVIWRNELDDAVVKSAATEEWFLEDIVGGVGGINPQGSGDIQTEESDGVETAELSADTPDFREFLGRMDFDVEPEASTPTYREEPAPSRNLWSMQIGLGGTAQTIEVPYESDIVDEASDEMVEEPAEETTAASSVGAMSAVRIVGQLLLGL